MLKKIDARLRDADENGTVDGKALAIKLALIAGVTVAGIALVTAVKAKLDDHETDPQ